MEVAPRQIYGQLPPPITIDAYGGLPAAHNRVVVFDGRYYWVVYKHAVFGGNYHDIFYASIDKSGILKKTEKMGFTENLIVYGLDMYLYPGASEILLGYAYGTYIRARAGTLSDGSISWSTPTSLNPGTARTASVIRSTDNYYWFSRAYANATNYGNSLANIFASACTEFTTSYEVTAGLARLPDNYILVVESGYAETQINWYKHKQGACGSVNNLAAKTANYHLFGKLSTAGDVDGNAHTVYEDTAGALQYKKYTYSTNSWSAPTQLDDDVEYCVVGVDAGNLVYVFWTRPSPDNNIYCRVLTPAGWSAKYTAFSEASHPGPLSCEHRSPRSNALGLSWALGYELRFGIYPPADSLFHLEKIF